MTISSQTRKAGPFNGNDVTTAFPFTFKVFSAADVYVVEADDDDVESVLTLNSDYTVSLNANQNTNPGGTVTLGAALATGHTLVLTSAVSYLQPTDLTNQGGFYPKVINDALDRLTILLQQTQEEVDRSAKLPITSAADADALVADIVLLADNVTPINTVAGAISSVTTVAGISANVTTVAGISANVTTVAGISANVTTVAGIDTEVAAVAGIAADVGTVADVAASVVAVAAIDADVTTVAGINAAVQTAANNVADITNFADVYIGASASDPTTRADASPLQAGDLYFNTSITRMKVYTGAAWSETPNGSMSVQTFSGDGVETDFVLAAAPASENNTQVYIGGVYQQKSEYSISGTTLTFGTAPIAGTDNIEVVVVSTFPMGETSSDLVEFTPAGTGAAARTVQDKLREVVSVKDFGAMGDGVTDDTAAIQSAIDYAESVGGGVVFVPEGEYKILYASSTGGLYIKDNVTVFGEGVSSILSAFADNTGSYVIGTRKEVRPQNDTVFNVGLKNLKIVGPLALVGSHVDSTVEIEWADGALLENLVVENGSDACIRICGYGPGSFSNDIESAHWNNTHNVRIINCITDNGYLNIELEGGPENVDVIGCSLKSAQSHAFRIASGYNVRFVNNSITEADGRGVWVDRYRDVLISGNYIDCVGAASTCHGISIGGFDTADSDDHSQLSTGLVITNNIVKVVGGSAMVDSYHGSSTKYSTGMLVQGNTVNKDILLNYSKDFVVVGNARQGAAVIGPWNGDSNGVVSNNAIPLSFDAGGYTKSAGKGGAVFVSGNVVPESGLPSRPTVQGGFAGAASAPPATGTWDVGHWVQNADIALSSIRTLPFGWVCVVAGTPGTWLPFGYLDNQYSKTFKYRRDGSNQSRTMLQFTVPNNYHALRISVDLMYSRAPSGTVGTSRVVHQEFFVARNLNTDSVIDSALSTNNFNINTTTAGGANNAADPTLALAIASGSSTDPQVLNLTAYHTGLSYVSAVIDVMSTSPISDFGL